MKMIFNYDANKTHFHNKGFALNLVSRVSFLELGNGLLMCLETLWPTNRIERNVQTNKVASKIPQLAEGKPSGILKDLPGSQIRMPFPYVGSK